MAHKHFGVLCNNMQYFARYSTLASSARKFNLHTNTWYNNNISRNVAPTSPQNILQKKKKSLCEAETILIIDYYKYFSLDYLVLINCAYASIHD